TRMRTMLINVHGPAATTDVYGHRATKPAQTVSSAVASALSRRSMRSASARRWAATASARNMAVSRCSARGQRVVPGRGDLVAEPLTGVPQTCAGPARCRRGLLRAGKRIGGHEDGEAGAAVTQMCGLGGIHPTGDH